MSRRIVQITATPAVPVYEPGAGVSWGEESLYALDNNGVAWVMSNPSKTGVWVRLPELPSFTVRPNPPRDTLAEGTAE